MHLVDLDSMPNLNVIISDVNVTDYGLTFFVSYWKFRVDLMNERYFLFIWLSSF
jgi:hypothetical protein